VLGFGEALERNTGVLAEVPEWLLMREREVSFVDELALELRNVSTDIALRQPSVAQSIRACVNTLFSLSASSSHSVRLSITTVTHLLRSSQSSNISSRVRGMGPESAAALKSRIAGALAGSAPHEVASPSARLMGSGAFAPSPDPMMAPSVAESVGKSPVWKSAKPFANGGMAGMAATCVIQPIDIIKASLALASLVSPRHHRISIF